MYNIYFNCSLTICILYDIIYVKKDNLKHARTCMYNINYHIVFCPKYRHHIFKDELEYEILKLFKVISYNYGF